MTKPVIIGHIKYWLKTNKVSKSADDIEWLAEIIYSTKHFNQRKEVYGYCEKIWGDEIHDN